MAKFRSLATSSMLRDMLIIVAVGSLSLTWFKGEYLLWTVDSCFALNLHETINRYYYTWDYKAAPGRIDAKKFAFLMPIGFLLGLYDLLLLPFNPLIFEEVVLFTLFTLSGVSMYLSFLTFTEENRGRGALFAAILYMANFYSMTIIWAPLASLIFHYAFLPLILAFYAKGIRERKGLTYVLFIAIMWSLTVTPGYTVTPLVVTDWLVILGYLIFHAMITRNLRDIKHSLYFTMGLMTVWIALNAFWILPVISSVSTELQSRETSLFLWSANSASLLDAFRLGGYLGLRETYKSSQLFPWYNVYDTVPFMLIGYLMPVLASMALLLKKRDRETLFFSILLLIALFIVKGPNPPLGEINTWLFSHQTIAIAFRSVYARVMVYVVLAYSFLISTTIGSLSAKFAPKRIHLFSLDKLTRGKQVITHIRFIFAFALAFLLVGVYAWPLWTGNHLSTEGIIPSKRVKIPDYYYQAAQWLNEQQEEFNILPLPFPHKTASAVFWWGNGTQGYFGTYPFILLSSKPTVIASKIGGYVAESIVNGSATNSTSLTLLNVKYVVLHRDSNWQYIGGHDWWISNTVDQLQLALNSIIGLRLDKSFGKLDFYKNLLWKPMHIYATHSLSGEDITSMETISDITITTKNPTEYEVRITAKQPFFLILSESYDEGWKLYSEDEQVSGEHLKVNWFANGWYLNKTGRLNLTLTYEPERTFKYGLVVSSVAFAFSIALLVISRRTKARTGLKT